VQLIRGLSDLPARVRGGALAIGNFDGVHLGHACLLDRLVQQANRLSSASVVFTFDPHPMQLLRPASVPPPLTWIERKAALLGNLGVDFVIAYPTDETLLSLSPEKFFRQIVVELLAAGAIVEGPNFCFGKDRAGDIRLLGELSQQAGCHLEVVEAMQHGGTTISSSRIRQLIGRGQIDEANSMLTRPYRLRGLVEPGVQRGRELGFQTANLTGVDTLCPAPAVYAGRASTGPQSWPAAIHIGPAPTFSDSQSKLEVHLIGFQGSLYGTRLEVDFLARLRDIQRFADRSALTAQLQADVESARSVAEQFRDRQADNI